MADPNRTTARTDRLLPTHAEWRSEAVLPPMTDPVAEHVDPHFMAARTLRELPISAWSKTVREDPMEVSACNEAELDTTARSRTDRELPMRTDPAHDDMPSKDVVSWTLNLQPNRAMRLTERELPICT